MLKFVPALLGLLLFACSDESAEEPTATDRFRPEPTPSVKPEAKPQNAQPAHVTVDHILIGVKNPNFPRGQRDDQEARELAYKIVELLEDGANFDDLKRKYSEDGRGSQKGGPYAMANHGVRPDFAKQEASRGDMVAAFGNIGFNLEVGEIGVADYTPQTRESPFGYHIIKRVE